MISEKILALLRERKYMEESEICEQFKINNFELRQIVIGLNQNKTGIYIEQYRSYLLTDVLDIDAPKRLVVLYEKTN